MQMQSSGSARPRKQATNGAGGGDDDRQGQGEGILWFKYNTVTDTAGTYGIHVRRSTGGVGNACAFVREGEWERTSKNVCASARGVRARARD